MRGNVVSRADLEKGCLNGAGRRDCLGTWTLVIVIVSVTCLCLDKIVASLSFSRWKSVSALFLD